MENKPTEITSEDIDRLMEILGNSEIKQSICLKCSKKHFPNYGHLIMECDECYFSRFTKEERERFYRSLFE